MTENKFKYTKAYFKIKDLILNNPQENVFVIRGGQGASKTISILQLVIQSLLSSEKEATVLSSELSKMKKTVIRDYKKICKDWGIIQDDHDFNKSESKHEYQNDSYIDFLGADVTDLGKGYRRDILYINEADRLEIDTATQFISRAKITIIDYNPDTKFWGDDYINENNFLTLTFEDNEYLDDSEVQSILQYKVKGFHNPDLPLKELFKDTNIKNNYWANRWRVYGLGMIGSLDGVCIPDWKEIDRLPPEAKFLCYGMDFGFTNDPTTVIGLYQYNNSYIFHELIYEKGLMLSPMASKMKSLGVGSNDIVYADSSSPLVIAELKGYGLSVHPCSASGKTSVVFGINLINQNEVFVTKSSANLISELKSYTWMKDKEGNSMNKPIDAFNHAIDAARYALTSQLENPHAGTYHVW